MKYQAIHMYKFGTEFSVIPHTPKLVDTYIYM